MAVESSSGLDDQFAQLRRVAPAATLVVRDYIKGLEAEAGSARTVALRAEADRKQSVERLEIENLELRQELAEAKAELDVLLTGRGRLTRRVAPYPVGNRQ